jgi:hypothetical protein
MPDTRRCAGRSSTSRKFGSGIRREGSAGSKNRAQAFDIRRGQRGVRVGSHRSFNGIGDAAQFEFSIFPERVCGPRVTVFRLTNASWINNRCVPDPLQKRPMGMPEK